MMDKQPLLTVVVPVYNGEKYIEETMRYIGNSEYKELEILVIDDGSTDQSGRVCREYQKQDERVRYIYMENTGIAGARNKGLELAGGEYICFCDQDDVTEPFMYKEILEKMLVQEAQIGMCSTGRSMEGRKSIYEKLEDGCYREEEIRSYLLYPLLFRGFDYPFVKRNNYLYGTIWKCIFNRSFLTEIGLEFKSFVNFEDDWLFVTEALTAAKTVVSCQAVGYYWRVNTASKSHKKYFEPELLKKFAALDRYVDGYLQRGNVEPEVLQEYQKTALCEHYAEGYKNAVYAAKMKRTYKRELREYLVKSGYKTTLECVSRLRGSAIRRKIMYLSLKYIGMEGTFFINRALLFLEEAAGQLQWFIRLERKWKMKG